MKTIYVIYRGQGDDSGFGDYCSNWEDTPMTLNGDILWFNDREIAYRIAKELTDKSADKFYGAGRSDSYDGRFPIEYESREVVIPENAPSDLNYFQELVNQEQDDWDWFSLNGAAQDVSDEVKDLHPNLYECQQCKAFGYKRDEINFLGVCVYCELETAY